MDTLTRGQRWKRSSTGAKKWKPSQGQNLPNFSSNASRSACIGNVYERSPMYRRKFDLAGIKPHDIRTLDEIENVPFTLKEELRESQAEHPPWGDFICIDPEQGVRVFQTSGTTGIPVKAILNKKDWTVHYYEEFKSFYVRLRHKEIRYSICSVQFWTAHCLVGVFSRFRTGRSHDRSRRRAIFTGPRQRTFLSGEPPSCAARPLICCI